MYCKYCGQQNIKGESYCNNCGKNIKTNSLSMEKRNISEIKTAYCKKCGSQVNDRYCISCGTMGYSINAGQEIRFKKPEVNFTGPTVEDIKSKFQESPLGDIKSVEDVKKIIMDKPIFKTSLISAAKILGVGLLISLILFFSLKNIKAVEGFMNAIDEVASYEYGQIAKMKPNFIDIFNLSLQSPANISLNFQGENYGTRIDVSAKVLMSFKMLILLIIPVIAVLIGQFKVFKDEKTTTENILEYGLTSFMFTIIATIIGLVNKRGIRISEDYFNFKLNIGFQHIWSLISIFMIIFVTHLIISMIFKKDNPFEVLNIRQYPDLGNRIYTYIKSMGIYIGLVSLTLTLIIVYMISKAKVKATAIIGIIIAPVLFVHTWFLSLGYGLESSINNGLTTKFDIWKIWKGIANLKRLNRNSDSGAMWAYLSLILVFTGLIYVIYRVVKDIEKEDYFKKLGFIAGVISIINIIFSYLGTTVIKTSTKVLGDYDLRDILYEMDLEFLSPILNAGALKQSYNIIGIVIFSFVWIFAIGGLIYLIREQEVYGKIEGILADNNKIILIVYPIALLLTLYLFQSKLLESMRGTIYNIFRTLGSLIPGLGNIFSILELFL